MPTTREQIHLPSGHSFRVLRWTRNLQEVDSLLSPGKVLRIPGKGMNWHYHVEMELTLFTAGEGTRFVGDHIGPFSAGDVVLLGERLPHYWHTHGLSAGLSVQWNFPSGHPLWTFPESLPLVDLFKRAGRGIRFTGRTAGAVAERLYEVARTSGVHRLATLLRMLALMCDAPPTDQTVLSARAFSLSMESSHQQSIDQAVRYLVANFRDELRLSEVLRLTGMSKPTFSRQFKKHSGKTYSSFVNHIRLQAACRELADTQRSVLDIAMSCGFGQISFFNRIFRRVLRCSPSEYRTVQRRKRKQAGPASGMKGQTAP